MTASQQIDPSTLQNWLETGKKVTILDLRPQQEREEWFIPGSIHVNAYDKLKQNDSSVFDRIALDKSRPLVTVCGAGKTSMIAAAMLKDNGFETYSLSQGMKGWSLAWNSAVIDFPEYKVLQLRRTGKGCLSYIIVSDKE